MKYVGTYWNLMSFLMRKYLKKRYGSKNTRTYIKNGKIIYKQMLEETDNIGEGNPMSGIIYMCYVFIAIWKAAKGVITIDDMRAVTQELMRSKIVRKAMGGADINDSKQMKKFVNKLKDNAKWAENHPQYKDKTWDFNFDSTKHDTGFYYHFTRCPLEKYCREHDLLDILPVMCDIDFLTAELKHAKLYREQTLAKGGDKCDYWFIGDKQ